MNLEGYLHLVLTRYTSCAKILSRESLFCMIEDGVISRYICSSREGINMYDMMWGLAATLIITMYYSYQWTVKVSWQPYILCICMTLKLPWQPLFIMHMSESWRYLDDHWVYFFFFSSHSLYLSFKNSHTKQFFFFFFETIKKGWTGEENTYLYLPFLFIPQIYDSRTSRCFILFLFFSSKDFNPLHFYMGCPWLSYHIPPNSPLPPPLIPVTSRPCREHVVCNYVKKKPC